MQPTPAVVIHLPLPLIFAILRFTRKNYKTYPGDFHRVLDAIFQNKELVYTFSCVYLPLLHPAQNKRVYRLNSYWFHMPAKLSSPGFADLCDIL